MVKTSQKAKIHQTWSLCETMYRLIDVASILTGLVVAVRLQVGQLNDFYLLSGAAAVILFYLLGEITGMYRNWRGVSVEREIVCASGTWGATVPTSLVLATVTRYSIGADRSFIFTWTLLTFALLVTTRLGLRMVLYLLRSRGYNARGFAVVGINDLAIELAHRIKSAPELGLELKGFYDDRDDERLMELPDAFGEKLGTVEELLASARSSEVTMIFITFPMRAEDRIKSVLDRLGDTTASVYIVPDFFVFELLHSRWTNISGLPAVSVFENPFYGIDGFLKRFVDVVLATCILIVFSLPMLVIGALIKWSSPGSVFFRQKRYGLDGREIMVWKFRSMTVCEDGDNFTQATRNDQRTTKVGAILRSTSLDELPQLFNVLDGSMSLVGPRPHASLQNEEFRKLIQGYMLRHKVKPGITGLAQVNGWRGETDTLEKMERRIECDHRYIREWSLLMDLKILIRTVFIVLSRQNAY